MFEIYLYNDCVWILFGFVKTKLKLYAKKQVLFQQLGLVPISTFFLLPYQVFNLRGHNVNIYEPDSLV